MKCSKCGRELVGEPSVCIYCGNRLQGYNDNTIVLTPDETAGSISQLRTYHQTDTQRTAQAMSTGDYTLKKARKSSSSGIIIGVVSVAVLVVIAVIAVIIVGVSSYEPDPPVTAESGEEYSFAPSDFVATYGKLGCKVTGDIKDNTYSNSYLGIELCINDNWVLVDKESMFSEYNRNNPDIIKNEKTNDIYTDYMGYRTYYDLMICSKSDTANIQLSIAENNGSLTAESYLQTLESKAEESYTSVVEDYIGICNYQGIDFYVENMICVLNGVEYYQILAVSEVRDTIDVLTITVSQESDMDFLSIMNEFNSQI